MATTPALENILKGILDTKDENTAMKWWELLNLKRREDKQLGSSTDLVAHLQTLTKQKQLNGRTHYIPLNINTECPETLFGKQD
jgi:hypothetical protein